MIGRVSERATFEAFRRHGRRGRKGSVTVVHLPGDDRPPRVALAVGRKVGSAVVRNKVRRRLREIMRDMSRDGRLPPGDYLIAVRPDVATISYPELVRLVRAACDEAAAG